MPFFIPQEKPRALPTPGAAIELAVMDWKVAATATDFHKAKDVAAFANHLGGTLLIGAHEKSGQLAAYVGMTPADAGAVRNAFSQAVKDRCEPLPRIDCAEYDDPSDPSKRIVAVNVWPSVLLIGVKITAHKPTEGYGGESYVYPVRSGTDADYLTPSQIAMYMTPQVRRIAVLCNRVPKGALVTIKMPLEAHQYNGFIDEVKEDENIVTFIGQDGSSKIASIPLDCITTIYETIDTNTKRPYWQMYVNYRR